MKSKIDLAEMALEVELSSSEAHEAHKDLETFKTAIRRLCFQHRLRRYCLWGPDEEMIAGEELVR